MIYTDGTHLISDKSLDELHSFAQSIGLNSLLLGDNPNWLGIRR